MTYGLQFYSIVSVLATKEREAIQEIVMKIVEEALNQRLSASDSVASTTAAANESKRLELLERVVRLEEGQKNILARLGAMQQETNRRFDDLIHYVDKRFEQVERRFRFQQWLIGGGFALLVFLMTLYTFFAA